MSLPLIVVTHLHSIVIAAEQSVNYTRYKYEHM